MFIRKPPNRRRALRRALLGAIFISNFNTLAFAQEIQNDEPVSADTVSPPESSDDQSTPPSNMSLPPISVTATREPTPLSETPANVSVITRDEMDRRMQNSIQDLIRYEPGIIVDRQTSGTDPFKSLGGFTIRGVSGNRVLTLIDGNRVIERITDQTRDFVDLGNMKAVEIVRGPASALWGSDALGGVVAFTTKDPEDYLDPTGNDWGFEANGFYASLDNSFTENATAAGRYGKLEGLVSYTRRDAEEPELTSARNDDGVWPCTRAPESLDCDEFDPLDLGSDNILAKLVFHPNDDHQFKLTGEYFHRNTEVEQLWDHGRNVLGSGALGTTITHDYDRQQVLDRKRLTLEHEWDVGASFLDSINWQVTYHPQDLDRNGLRLQSTPTTFTERFDSLKYSEDFFEGQGQFKSSFDIGDISNELTYGFYASYAATDYKRKDITTNLLTGAVTETIAGGFNFANAETTRIDGYLQDDIGLFDDRLHIIPGVRYATYRIEPNPGPGYQIVPGAAPQTITEQDVAAKVGATFQIDDNFSVYAQYGEGFKMPTAEQLYTSLPGVGFNLVPNPDLKPESVRNYELGLRGEFDHGFFSVNGFFSDYKNFIQSFVSVPGTVDITYQNMASVKIWGIEGTGSYQFHPNWAVDTGLSWQIGNSVAEPGAESLPFNGAEPFKIVTGLRYINDELGFDAELVGTYQMGMTRLNDSPAEDFASDDYFVLDANLQWRPIENLALRASVLNILDERYFLPSSSTYDAVPSTAAVAATNPLELQTQPGRTFRVGLSVSF